jgi:hypothetical protein
MVVTTPEDVETQKIAQENNAKVFTTRSFYDDGAIFNKWIALEEGLDAFGRHGLMVIMDADIRWPKRIKHQNYEMGKLYTPRRRVLNPIKRFFLEEKHWRSRARLRNESEWAGYTQIFYADDPHLPNPPWHEIDWIYGAGGDSSFQRLWPQDCKVRPSWEVLHLGPLAANWCGRVSPRMDGRNPEKAEERRFKLAEIMRVNQLQRIGRRTDQTHVRLGKNREDG